MSTTSLVTESSSRLMFTNSLAIQKFPWIIGLPLSVGSIQMKVHNGLANAPAVDAHQAEFLMALASNLDSFDLPELFPELRQLQNAREYLSASVDMLLNTRNWDRFYNSDLVSVTHLVMRFLLLDRLADAFGFSREPSQLPRTRRFLRNNPTKQFARTIHHLNVWTNPMKRAQKLCKDVETFEAAVDESVFDLAVHQPYSEDQSEVVSKIAMLRRAAMHISSAELNQILTNLEVLSFGIGWFGLQNCNLFDGGDEWIGEVKRIANAAGLPLKTNFVEILKSSKVYERMKNLFHLATSVSPLLALSGNRFQNMPLRRDQLIAANVVFGNERPPLLAATERELWRALFRINKGSNAMQELSAFLQRFQNLQVEYDGQDPQLDWFSPDRMVSQVKVVTANAQRMSLQDGVGESPLEVRDSSTTNFLQESNPAPVHPMSPMQAPSSPQGSSDSELPEADTEDQTTLAVHDSCSRVVGSLPPQPSTSKRASASHHSTQPPHFSPSCHPGVNSEESLSDLTEDLSASPSSNQIPCKASSAAKHQAGKKQVGSDDDVSPPPLKPSEGEGENESEGQSNDDSVKSNLKGKGRAKVKRKTKKTSAKSSKFTGDSSLPANHGKSKPPSAREGLEGVVQNLTGVEQKNKPVSMFPIPKISDGAVGFVVFDGEVSDEGTPVNFFATASTAKADYEVLNQINRRVTSRFENGLPPHRLPPTRAVEYDPKGSSIFICEWNDFQKYSAAMVQEIFRHRHILIRNGPVEQVEFSLQGLELLGSLTARVDFQVAELRQKAGHSDLLRQGTLLDLYEAGTNSAKLRILNGLDFPMGHGSTPPPPSYRHFASQEISWKETQRQKGFPVAPPPLDDINWGTAATKGASTLPHVDDEGFATVVTVLNGSKYWVVMQSKQEVPDGEHGDQNTIHAYPPSWGDGPMGFDIFEAEGIHLKAGDTFYMRPNTLHYVLGLENTIMLGRHFYATSTIFKSCLGIIHTLILGLEITNQIHEKTRTLLRRLLTMWLDSFLHSSSVPVSPFKLAHIPEITKPEGLLNLIMVGNIIEYSRAFALRFADHLEDSAVIEEENIARWKYRKFMAWFASNYVTIIGDQVVSPWYIFHRALIEFASTLCAYKKLWPDKTDFSVSELQEMIAAHIQADWPMLLDRFMQLLDSPAKTFRWTGPSFEIWNRDSLPQHFIILELSELPAFPIFSFGANQGGNRRSGSMTAQKSGRGIRRGGKVNDGCGNDDEADGDDNSGHDSGEAMDTGEDDVVESGGDDDREDDGDVRMRDNRAGGRLRRAVRARADSSAQSPNPRKRKASRR